MNIGALSDNLVNLLLEDKAQDALNVLSEIPRFTVGDHVIVHYHTDDGATGTITEIGGDDGECYGQIATIKLDAPDNIGETEIDINADFLELSFKNDRKPRKPCKKPKRLDR